MFDELLVRPIINILLAIYQLLVFLHIPYPLGFSIILLTVVIRFILYPFTASQLKASTKMQKLSPHLSNLKEKHKNDSKRLQEETMKLYKEHGVNPAAGCLPVIIQLPIIWGLYSVLGKIVSISPQQAISEINRVVYFDALKIVQAWDQRFFGILLGKNPNDLISTVPLIVLIPVATGFFQFIQSKMMYASPSGQPVQKKKSDDFSSAFQTQSMYIFPVMIGFFSYTLPIGLSLYWNTFTIFGILQQYQISGLGGLEEWIGKIKDNKHIKVWKKRK